MECHGTIPSPNAPAYPAPLSWREAVAPTVRLLRRNHLCGSEIMFRPDPETGSEVCRVLKVPYGGAHLHITTQQVME